MWSSKKEKNNLTARSLSPTEGKKRKRKLFWGENWKNKPYLKRRLLDHLDFISRYVALSPLLHPISPSLPIRSLSSSHPKTAPSAPPLRSPLLHFFIPSHLSSISPSLLSLPSPFFPFPITLHLSTRKLPLLLFAS